MAAERALSVPPHRLKEEECRHGWWVAEAAAPTALKGR
jgi:hypothetical protein